ncbi:MAG: glycerophosphodiester phosphodiesterase [Oscillospiraceae bacterium]|nr:glycerophosphodiester phosphodiesterase [Oscillospiraceae bacterium]
MTVFLIIVVILVLLYLFALKGRTGHPGLEKLRGWHFAHRGLHDKNYEGIPENSMTAFRAALDAGYGVEFDVHLLADGELAVIHDSPLKRTTGAEGKIEELTIGQLKDYRLENTDDTIPSFREVLDLFAGKAPMVIELKAAGGNHAALCKKVCEVLDGYEADYCIESFDPRCIWWLKKNRPDIVRGQLASNFIKDKQNLPLWQRIILTMNLTFLLTRPDFVAYNFADRNTLGNFIARKLWKVQGVVWTIRSEEDHKTALKEGWWSIFEYFRP